MPTRRKRNFKPPVSTHFHSAADSWGGSGFRAGVGAGSEGAVTSHNPCLSCGLEGEESPGSAAAWRGWRQLEFSVTIIGLAVVWDDSAVVSATTGWSQRELLRMITKQQSRKLMSEYQVTGNVTHSAMKAAMSSCGSVAEPNFSVSHCDVIGCN